MNELQYEEWSKFYDKQDVELKEINNCISDNYQNSPWKKSRVLEIGCGSGRFTFKIIDDVNAIIALDPDVQRIDLLKDKLLNYPCGSKCTPIVGDLLSVLNQPIYANNFSEKFDFIIFSWSWAFIPEIEMEKVVQQALDLIKETGTIIFTMVVGGEFESFIYHFNRNSGEIDEIERNKNAIQYLRNIMAELPVKVKEIQINTDFTFSNIDEATDVIMYSINEQDHKDNIRKALQKYTKAENKIVMTDIVACLCVSKLTKNEIENPAKITFNYKKCDNRGECSAEKICRKHRSAILRDRNNNIWYVDNKKCDECGQCRSVCELFNVHSDRAEFFEKLREIEAMTIEPDFFDKDRFGSGSFHPSHKIDSFEKLKQKIQTNTELLIVEIADGARLTSSFDAILINEIIPTTYYERCFYKFIIPRTNQEQAGEVQVVASDAQHEKECEEVMKYLSLNELPALIFFKNGNIDKKIEGMFRLVDTDRRDYFVNTIQEYLKSKKQ